VKLTIPPSAIIFFFSQKERDASGKPAIVRDRKRNMVVTKSRNFESGLYVSLHVTADGSVREQRVVYSAVEKATSKP
jgi:hypothetical protein